MTTTIVVGEVRGGRLLEATSEAVGVARRLGASRVVGVLTLATDDAAVDAFARTGLDALWVVRLDPQLAFTPAAQARSASEAAARESADLVLVGGTVLGRDIAGRLAIRWEAQAVTGVTEVQRIGPTTLGLSRPVFGGRATQELRVDAPRV
ncbi:MAG: hypothetical protein L3J73_02720, partial [Thermoplasmata archaeon]|nr:hypothetical protein [Thermoplasmata archaeon]